ncbi:ParB/RepB/Spo0J family partition protein [Chachezhania sediminis]|uniref:ParB/RepB/Spo0J family partition protein n=1 Tax=Chachezhania sediminis TaxID=2599291 RepID=UPI001E374A8C|nr:ParB/RepB/Spo0J family partition protein [Chachezhania sediminis]
MARKLLGDVGGPDDRDETETSPARPRRRSSLIQGGAAAPRYIEASARSQSERTHQDIQIDQIQPSRIEDRIDVNEGLDELVDNIDKNGQQIPIIVRIVNQEKPYEIVAGRRRLAALRKLGRTTVKGYITRMSDKEAFIAQGIENSARLETSFIERARTAVKASEAGFLQDDISEFLAISQPLVSAMVRTYKFFDEDCVVAIGPARGIGRRKWDQLMTLCKDGKIGPDQIQPLIDPTIAESSDRFEDLFTKVAAGVEGKAKAPSSRSKPGARGAVKTTSRSYVNGSYASQRMSRQLLIKAGKSADEGLLDYISDRLPQLIEDFRATKAPPEK